MLNDPPPRGDQPPAFCQKSKAPPPSYLCYPSIVARHRQAEGPCGPTWSRLSCVFYYRYKLGEAPALAEAARRKVPSAPPGLLGAWTAAARRGGRAGPPLILPQDPPGRITSRYLPCAWLPVGGFAFPGVRSVRKSLPPDEYDGGRAGFPCTSHPLRRPLSHATINGQPDFSLCAYQPSASAFFLYKNALHEEKFKFRK